MYSEHVAYFVDAFQKADLGSPQPITEENRALFEHGADAVLMYRGDSETLISAARIFLTTGVRAYIYAGAAEVIFRAAYISSGNYEKDGLAEGERYLKMALKEEPNRFEIKRVEATLHTMRKDARATRHALDTLHAMDEGKNNARLAILEISYWQMRKDPEKAKKWAEKAIELAANNMQAISALNTLAGFLLSLRGHMDEALGIYQRLVQIDGSDAWAWHNMSIICLQQKDYEKAGFYNRRALDIANFGAAESVRAKLIRRWNYKVPKDPLEDVPRFLSAGADSSNLKAEAKLLRKLFKK